MVDMNEFLWRILIRIARDQIDYIVYSKQDRSICIGYKTQMKVIDELVKKVEQEGIKVIYNG